MRSFVLCLVCLFTSQAGADTHLVEIRFPGHHFGAGEILPTLMNFGASINNTPFFAGFSNSYTVADVGSVYEATPAEVASIAPLLYELDSIIVGYTMTDPAQWGVDAIWSTSQYITPQVPRIGFGLEGYTINRITQTVDYLTWTPSGAFSGGFNGEGQQTIRLYGKVVPEPVAIVLLVLGSVHLITLARRQRD